MLYNRVLHDTQQCLSERNGVHTIGRITCLEDYACALLVTISANRSSNGQSKQGLSCIVRVNRFNLQVSSKAEHQTRLSFVHPERRAFLLSLTLDERGKYRGDESRETTWDEKKIRSPPGSKYSYHRPSSLQENPFRF